MNQKREKETQDPDKIDMVMALCLLPLFLIISIFLLPVTMYDKITGSPAAGPAPLMGGCLLSVMAWGAFAIFIALIASMAGIGDIW